MDYLTLPLRLSEGHLRRGELRESIAHSIALILSTRVGSLKFEPQFGCEIWNKEFSDLVAANKADIRGQLRNAIDRFERRLSNVSVDFAVDEDARAEPLGIRVKVSGHYTEDGRELRFESSHLLG